MSEPIAERAARVFDETFYYDREATIQRFVEEFVRVRAEARKTALEDAAKLIDQVRCRVWTPGECALAVRTMDHPLECSCHRWVDCGKGA